VGPGAVAVTSTPGGNRLRAMDNDVVKRLMWSGMLAAAGVLARIAADRVAGVIWRRVFDEEPPE